MLNQSWNDNGHHSQYLAAPDGYDVSVCKWSKCWWFGIQRDNKLVADGTYPSREKAKAAAEAAVRDLA